MFTIYFSKKSYFIFSIYILDWNKSAIYDIKGIHELSVNLSIFLCFIENIHFTLLVYLLNLYLPSKLIW